MSVTRNIKANEATQVNSNLIGVQIHPIVTAINFRFGYYKYFVYDGTYYGVDGVNYIYAGQWVIYEEQIYYRLNRRSILTNTPQYLYFKGEDSTSRPETGDTVYTYQNGVIAEYSSVGPIVEWNGGTVEFYQINEENDGFISLYNSNGSIYGNVSTVDYVVNIVNPSTQEKMDIALTRMQSGNEVETAYYLREYNGLYQWTVAGDKIGNRVMVTDNRNPLVGEKVRFENENNGLLKIQYPYNIQGTQNESLNCKVEYSIDGVIFTAVGDSLTDVNNVIANIPRYVYLRFGQDVEITEE